MRGQYRGGYIGFGRLGFKEACEIVFVGQWLAVRPGCAFAQGVESRLRTMFGLADDTGKTAIAYDCNKTGHRARAILLQFGKFRARVVRPKTLSGMSIR